MKTIKMLFCISMLLAVGCKKDKNKFIDTIQPAIKSDFQAVKISFPDGIAINYTDYSLFSLADNANPDASGNVKAPYNKGNTNIAWLMDKNNNPVMAGFVNDTISTINATSTAKVMLYYAYAIPMMPKAMQSEFVNTIGSISGFSEWASQFATLLKSDLSVISRNGHIEALKNAMENMSKKKLKLGNTSTIGKQMNANILDKVAIRNADISVITPDIKSGIQVFSKEMNKVEFTNYYRRRAHAFFYKTKFKDLAGIPKGILSEINETTASDKDESLSPTSAINSLTGVIGNWIENRNSGQVLDFAAKQAGPFNFPLQDNESEATYKVRVMGPGKWPSGIKFTNAERTKLFRLEVETFAMDFLIPLTASYISSKIDLKPGKNATAQEREQFNHLAESVQTIVEEVIKGSPAVYDEMKAGNYKAALKKFMEAAQAGNSNAMKDGFLKVIDILQKQAISEKLYVSPHFEEVFVKTRLGKILEITDKILEISDYYNIYYDMINSNAMEDWELQLKGSRVTLNFVNGYDSLLNTADETKIKADIKNMNETGGDQHPYFEWSTTGKYGKLVDTKGHSGTSFASADDIVSYQSTTNSNDLKDGDNIDYIYVKASFNNVLLGLDTIAVNVKKVGYEMKPVDAIVTGKKHDNAANKVTLYLEKTSGLRDIPNHSDLDFKIEWSTTGAYGNLVGATTTYNDDDIVYTATSEQVGVFTENITARIYTKNKNETNYKFYDNVKGTVKVDNEQKKRIIALPVVIFHGDSNYQLGTSTRHLCVKYAGASIPEDIDAERYSVRFYPTTNIAGTTLSQSWKAGDASPSPPNKTDYPGHGGGYYNVTYAYGSTDRPINLGIQHAPDAPSYSGRALVTIYLK